MSVGNQCLRTPIFTEFAVGRLGDWFGQMYKGTFALSVDE